MKICSTCSVQKELSEFHKNSRFPDGHQYSCKECAKALSRDHYRRNKQQYLDRNKARGNPLIALIRELKNVPCTDCSVRYPYYVMQFDHVDPSQKSYHIDYLVYQKRSKRLLLIELDKCEIVCANCHMERTYGFDHELELPG